MDRPPLHLELLVPSPDHSAALGVSGSGTLPSYEAQLEPDETGVMLTQRLLEEQLGLRTPVLETHIPPDPGRTGAEPVVALAVCEAAPDGWALPPGLGWHRFDGPPPNVPAPIHSRAQTWLGEWRAGSPPPPLRARWSQPGWYGRATDWIRRSLDDAGRSLDGPIESRRLWGISALMYARTRDGGAVWFKAVFPPFAREPGVTAFLEGVAPGRVPHLVAYEPVEGWLLLDDVGAPAASSTAGRTAVEAVDDELEPAARLQTAIDAVVRLQRRLLGREDELRALGCPDRGLATLADEVARAVGGSPALPGVTLPPERIATLVEWVRNRADWLDAVGFPDVMLHGDFHTDNVLFAADGPVVIDWSDAAIGHPLMEIAAFFEDVGDPELCDACWEHWLAALAPLGDVEALCNERQTVEGLGDAYQVVTYAEILRNLEPANRYQLSDGLEAFLERLDGRVPA